MCSPAPVSGEAYENSSSEATAEVPAPTLVLAEPKPRCVAQKPTSLILFAGIVLAMLAMDLGLKHWSFQTVTDTALQIRVLEGAPVVHQKLNGAEGEQVWVPVPARLRRTPSGCIPYHAPKVLMPHVLNLHLVLNEGAVFGLGQKQRWMFLLVSLGAVVIIVWMLLKSPAKAVWGHVALALILAGALGNLHDRIRFAAVRDMLHMLPDVPLPFGMKWPGTLGGSNECWPWIFNLADVQLLAGMVLAFGQSFFGKQPKKAEAEIKSKPTG